MRKIALLAVASVLPCLADELSVESEVYEAPGKQADIAHRGYTCMARIVHNDAVNVTDSVQGDGPLAAALNNPFHQKTDRQLIPGGEVIASHDDSTVVAHSRIYFKNLFLGKVTVQSTISMLSKDGRFKIIHTDIGAADEHTGLAQNTGFEPVKPKTLFYEKTITSLKNLSNEIAKCVQKPDW